MADERSRSRFGDTTHPNPLRAPYADPPPDDIRDELIDASLINGKLVRDLEKARGEIDRLQQQLKGVGEEFERLNASTTHTQAELKTFQTERAQSKSELSSLRQKCASLEEALVARESELREGETKVAASVPVTDFEALEKQLREAERAVTKWEAKFASAKKETEKAVHKGDEWKTKAKTAESALTGATKQVSAREAELRTAEVALRKTQAAVADLETKMAEMGRAVAAGDQEREKISAELMQKVGELGEMQARFKNADEELHASRGRLGELEAALEAARHEALRQVEERSGVHRQLEEARAQFAPLTELQAQLARTEAELEAQGEKLRLSEETHQSLASRCDQLRRETDILRLDLAESHAGRELLETRARLEDALAERDRTAIRLSAAEADLQAFTSAEATQRTELERARRERDEAVERAETLRETRTAKDNQVLRGIIARLNSDLALRTSEVLRAKRARVGLKIALVLFGIGVLAVIIVALIILPQALRR